LRHSHLIKSIIGVITAIAAAVLLSGCTTSIELTTDRSKTPHSTAPLATDVPDLVEITDFSVTPLEDGRVAINACTKGRGGVGITLRVSYNTSSGANEPGKWKILKELGVPCFNSTDRPTWNTEELEPGSYLIRVEAKTADDPHWESSVSKTLIYQVK
jgi:hypothetical protein